MFLVDSFSSVFDNAGMQEGVHYTRLEEKVRCKPKEGVQVSTVNGVYLFDSCKRI